jgi:hypothetical protein
MESTPRQALPGVVSPTRTGAHRFGRSKSCGSRRSLYLRLPHPVRPGRFPRGMVGNLHPRHKRPVRPRARRHHQPQPRGMNVGEEPQAPRVA